MPTKVQKQRKQYKAASTARNRDFVYEYLRNHPCETCQEHDPNVLEFDHIDPEQKSFCVAKCVHHEYSIKRLKEEIEKCRVLCANCHRRHTIQQMGYYVYPPYK